MLRCPMQTVSTRSCRSHSCTTTGYRGSLTAAQASPPGCASLVANDRGWAPTFGLSPLRPRRLHRNERRLGKRQVSTQALFGVGAPEAVLVGVVALVVFGPKGLAEAVKSLGKTLKTFQPTIREVMSVSSELRSTLEEQIGLDDIRSELRSGMASESRPAARRPADQAENETVQDGDRKEVSGVDQLIEESEANLERKRSAAAAAAWGGQPPAPPAEVQSVPETPSILSSNSLLMESVTTYRQEHLAARCSVLEVEASSMHQGKELEKQVQLGALSLEDLEAELARRRGAAKQGVSQ